MTVLSPFRRLGLTVVAVAASATLVTACGSSTDGTPFKATGNGSGVVSAPSASTGSGDGGGVANSSPLPSASAPVASASAPAASASIGGSGGGGGTSTFCKQLTSLGTDFGGSLSDGQSAIKELAAKWEKLAASAPAEIKPDVQKIADYFKSFADGNMPDASKTSDLTTAASNIGKYLSTACI